MTDKDYWLYLAKIKGLGSGRRKVLLEMLGSPEEVFKTSESLLRKIPLLEDYQIDQILDCRKVDYEKEKDIISRQGIGFVTTDEKEFPEKLRFIPDAPFFLFYKGLLPQDTIPSVAIVGSRKCSIYGREMCMKFSARLAGAGINIISGMAAGIDGFAHRGSLNAGGKTTAVLGCGVDICYPLLNRDIFDKLSEVNNQNGGIISEYYPGERAFPFNFPQRNRIISGLADVVLVVEAGKKSGTFITVDHALEQGKEVFAIPGRIGDNISDGCNCLIKNGASMATEPEDIIETLKMRYKGLLADEIKRKKNRAAGLGKEEKKVYESLNSMPVQINEISERTGMECGHLSQILIGLELRNLIEEVGKNIYIKKI